MQRIIFGASIIVILLVILIGRQYFRKENFDNMCAISDGSAVMYNDKRYFAWQGRLYSWRDDNHYKQWGSPEVTVINEATFKSCGKYGGIINDNILNKNMLLKSNCIIRPNIAVRNENNNTYYMGNTDGLKKFYSETTWKNSHEKCHNLANVTQNMIDGCKVDSNPPIYANTIKCAPCDPIKPCPPVQNCPSCPVKTCPPCPPCSQCPSCGPCQKCPICPTQYFLEKMNGKKFKIVDISMKKYNYHDPLKSRLKLFMIDNNQVKDVVRTPETNDLYNQIYTGTQAQGVEELRGGFHDIFASLLCKMVNKPYNDCMCVGSTAEECKSCNERKCM